MEGRKTIECILMVYLNFRHSFHVHVKKASAPVIVRCLEIISKAAGESICSSHVYFGDKRRRNVYPFKFKAALMICLD